MSSDAPKPKRRVSDYVEMTQPRPVISEASHHIAEDLLKWLRILTLFTVVLYIGIGCWVAWTYSVTHSNRKALCALRADTQKRLDQSKDFLIDHPQGFLGISVSEIKAGIANSKLTVEALDDLDC
jgi:hypothetical protein